jgi:PAP2 superfamily
VIPRHVSARAAAVSIARPSAAAPSRVPTTSCGSSASNGQIAETATRPLSREADAKPMVVITALLAALLVPMLIATRMPLKFDWPLYFRFYLFRGVEAVPIAIMLLVSTMSLSGLSAKLRARGSWKALKRIFFAVAIPAAYFFGGLVVVFGYNDVIASVRFYALYDHFAAAADHWLLGGSSVSAIADGIIRAHPAIGSWADNFYATFYPGIGAVLIFLALRAGCERGLEFVNTLLVQYYLALIAFFVLPVQGPFYSAPLQFPGFVGAVQAAMLEQANQAFHHTKPMIGFDYFIGFPSLHVGMVVVAWWFLREWRIPKIIASLYLILVVPCVLLVGWHYVVDVIGGVAVAAASIALARFSSGVRPAVRSVS